MQKANGASVESPWLFSDPQDRTGEDRSSMACVSPGNRCFAGGKSHLCSFTESSSSTGMGKYGAFRLVKIYDLLQEQEMCCFIMEYLEGESLKEHILTTGEKKKRISGRKSRRNGG